MSTPDRVSQGVSLSCGNQPGCIQIRPGQFAINYDSGNVTLGVPLTNTQRLTVRYWPVGIGYADNLRQTVVEVDKGAFLDGAPDLTSAMIKEDQHMIYSPNKSPQTLFDFLKTNIAKKKAFLTAEGTNERDIEFTYDSNAKKPIQPRDPRYQFITAQPHASSSYGLLQVTFLLYGKLPSLKKILDPSKEPLYDLLTLPQKNFEMAAAFHNQQFITMFIAPAHKFQQCGPNDCNEQKWQDQWYRVINVYNPSGTGYSTAKSAPIVPKASPVIVTQGATAYAPQSPN